MSVSTPLLNNSIEQETFYNFSKYILCIYVYFYGSTEAPKNNVFELKLFKKLFEKLNFFYKAPFKNPLLKLSKNVF